MSDSDDGGMNRRVARVVDSHLETTCWVYLRDLLLLLEKAPQCRRMRRFGSLREIGEKRGEQREGEPMRRTLELTQPQVE